MAVTSDSECKSPADSSVWSSSTNNVSTRTFTFRIWRSMGSSQCFFSRSIAFNSSMVFVGKTLTVKTPPSKVLTFTSRTGPVAMAARNHCFPTNMHDLGATFGGSLRLRHNHLPNGSLGISSYCTCFYGNIYWLAPKPLKKNNCFFEGTPCHLYWSVFFSERWQVWLPCCAAGSLKSWTNTLWSLDPAPVPGEKT